MSFMLFRRSSGEPEGDRETVTEEVALFAAAAAAAGRRGRDDMFAADDEGGLVALSVFVPVCMSLSLGGIIEAEVHDVARDGKIEVGANL